MTGSQKYLACRIGFFHFANNIQNALTLLRRANIPTQHCVTIFQTIDIRNALSNVCQVRWQASHNRSSARIAYGWKTERY